MRPTTYHEHELFSDGPVLAGVYDVAGVNDLHGHDFCEIAVIGRGSGRHISAQGDEEVGLGDVFVLRPGAWHGFVGTEHLDVGNCCISAAELRTELGFLRELPAVHDLLWLGPHRPGSHGMLHKRIPAERAEAAIADIAALQDELAARPSNLVAQWAKLLGVLGHLVDTGEGHPAPHPAVTTAIALMEASPERPWHLEELARAVNLDPAYLSRLFRRDAGTPPMSYLARIRAETAAGLLVRTDEPTARIGGLVGWPDPTYFARRFRSLVGLTPTEYRRRTVAGGRPAAGAATPPASNAAPA
jgi:AraC-like DNA-binding protein